MGNISPCLLRSGDGTVSLSIHLPLANAPCDQRRMLTECKRTLQVPLYFLQVRQETAREEPICNEHLTHHPGPSHDPRTKGPLVPGTSSTTLFKGTPSVGSMAADVAFAVPRPRHRTRRWAGPTCQCRQPRLCGHRVGRRQAGEQAGLSEVGGTWATAPVGSPGGCVLNRSIIRAGCTEEPRGYGVMHGIEEIGTVSGRSTGDGESDGLDSRCKGLYRTWLLSENRTWKQPRDLTRDIGDTSMLMYLRSISQHIRGIRMAILPLLQNQSPHVPSVCSAPLDIKHVHCQCVTPAGSSLVLLYGKLCPPSRTTAFAPVIHPHGKLRTMSKGTLGRPRARRPVVSLWLQESGRVQLSVETRSQPWVWTGRRMGKCTDAVGDMSRDRFPSLLRTGGTGPRS